MILSRSQNKHERQRRTDRRRTTSHKRDRQEKVKYYMEEIDELIEIQDYSEMEIVNKRAVKIITKLSDLIHRQKN